MLLEEIPIEVCGFQSIEFQACHTLNPEERLDSLSAREIICVVPGHVRIRRLIAVHHGSAAGNETIAAGATAVEK